MSFEPRWFFLPQAVSPTSRLANGWTCRGRSSRSGASDSSRIASPGYRINLGAGVRPPSPPDVVVKVKALACELPKAQGLPLSRWSRRDLAREVVRQGIVGSISDITVWRWLTADAIRPWSYRSWISMRDPDFAEKASRVLDLYHRTWAGHPLGPNDYVISADEKTSIQARGRASAGTPVPGRLRRVESDYERNGALAYLAGWDVHRARIFGLRQDTNGIKPFQALVDLVMKQEPYCSARQVYWITDNGSSHRGESACARLTERYPNATLVHTPIHASWLNQIEIYFSIVQRKVLTPNEFKSLEEVEDALLGFQSHYEAIAEPFEWKFTKDDLKNLLEKANRIMAHPAA